MTHDFYNTQEYKEKQSTITKENWRKGIFDFHFRREKEDVIEKGATIFLKQFQATLKFIAVAVVLAKLIISTEGHYQKK